MSSLVSIIIPFYNAEKHIEKTIQSAISQTWQNKEIILIDDGSTDTSVPIVQKYVDDDKIKLLSQNNKGASSARNLGLKTAKGQYVQFLDADDLLSVEKIESQLLLLNGDTNKISFCKLFDLLDNEIIPKDNMDYSIFSAASPQEFLHYYLGIKESPHLGIHSWLFPLALIHKAGLWDETLSLDDDGEFTLRVILEAENGVVFSPEGRCYYRKHIGNHSLSTRNDYTAMKSAIKSHSSKLDALRSKGLDSEPVIRRFADGYKWYAINSYNRFPDLYEFCTKKVAELGGSRYKLIPGSRLKRALQNLFGWKFLRILEDTIKIRN